MHPLRRPFTSNLAQVGILRGITGMFAAENRANMLLKGKRLAYGRNSAFMDACQFVRKEAKMEVVHPNQKQLATR